MKKHLHAILFVFSIALMTVLSSCSSDDPKPVQQAKNRTVLVYMVATNSLGTAGYDDQDLDEMLTAAKNGDITDGHLLVYHASLLGNPVLKEITPDGIKILKEYNDTEKCSATATRMKQVISDIKALAPANDYGLVLWSHASGWFEDGLKSRSDISELDSDSGRELSTLSFGQDYGDKMNTTTLATVLSGQGFSFIYFDCCYMATIESLYELRRAAQMIVASPSELPTKGMPYEKNVKAFFARERADMFSAAQNTYEYYATHLASHPYCDMTDGYGPCTMAVINTRGLDNLALTTREIYKLTPLPHPLSNPTNYRGKSNKGDALDFGEYVMALCDANMQQEGMPELKEKFKDALATTVLYSAATDKLWNGLAPAGFSGLSTYVFEERTDVTRYGYTSLQWYNDVVKFHVN